MRWRRVSRVINDDGSIVDTFYDETAYPVLSPETLAALQRYEHDA